MRPIAAFLVAALLVITPVQAVEKPKDETAALERKLHGTWEGPACGGDWTYNADGTFEVRHYTPGNNRLTGTWEVRWNALPPTLVRTIQTTDAPDHLPVGKTWDVKVLQLDDEGFTYQYSEGNTIRYARMKTAKALERRFH